MTRRSIKGRMAVLVAGIAIAATANAASVTLATISAPAGTTNARLEGQLGLDMDQEVSGAQFVVGYDPAVLTLRNAEPGAAATAAMKQVSRQDIASGESLIVVTSLTNRTAIAEGTLVNLIFEIASDAPRTAHAVTIQDIVLTDPGGGGVPATGNNGGITATEPAPGGCGAGCGASGSWPDLPLMIPFALAWAALALSARRA